MCSIIIMQGFMDWACSFFWRNPEKVTGFWGKWRKRNENAFPKRGAFRSLYKLDLDQVLYYLTILLYYLTLLLDFDRYCHGLAAGLILAVSFSAAAYTGSAAAKVSTAASITIKTFFVFFISTSGNKNSWLIVSYFCGTINVIDYRTLRRKGEKWH